MPTAPIIIDRNYLATRSICRWWILYHWGDRILNRMPQLGMDLKSYLNLIKNAKEEYPLLAPFGNIYVLMPLKIDGNRVEMETSSVYGDDVYPEQFLSLLVYMAIEVVRSILYVYDEVLLKFRSYYDKIRERIPENYVIYLDGHEASVGLESSVSMWSEVCKPVRPVDSGTDCSNCPFVPYCPILNRSSHWRLRRNPPDLSSIIDRDDYDKIMTALTSLNVDYLLTLNLLMFARHMERTAFPNIGLLLGDFGELLESQFLYLRNGRVHKNASRMVHNAGIRIYDGKKDVTYDVLAKELAVSYFTTLKGCRKLERYFEKKGYGEYEKRLVYLSFLRPRYRKDMHELIPLDEMFLFISPDSNPLFVASVVYDSKPYRDGLIDVDPNSKSIKPKPKLMRIFVEKCEGDA